MDDDSQEATRPKTIAATKMVPISSLSIAATKPILGPGVEVVANIASGFLLAHRDEDCDEPVTDVLVLYANEEVPVGYRVLQPPIVEDTFICTSTDSKHGEPIFRIALGSEADLQRMSGRCVRKDLLLKTEHNQCLFLFLFTSQGVYSCIFFRSHELVI